MPIIGATYSLNANEVYASLFNMIIAEQVFSQNINGKRNRKLVDAAKAEVGLYGDSKNYWSTDVLKSRPFLGDAEATNLLATDRGPAPKGQRIVINVFRQIGPLTTDQYLSKRAWMSEDSHSQFISVMKGWLSVTKQVYDETTYNAFIGTNISGADTNTVTIDLTTALSGLTGLEKARMQALTIASDMADLFDDLGDVSRKFNVYKFLRSYSEDEIKVVWNQKYINRIAKIDLPTVYNKDGVMEKFDEYSLPRRYFGTVITSTNVGTYSAATAAAGKPLAGTTAPYTYTPGTNNANGIVRTLVETDITVGGTTTHLFAGDELPASTSVTSAMLGSIYIEDSKVICKVMTKIPPYMSAFEVGTSFYNPRSLSENAYLTFGHNTIEQILDSAYVTVKEV